MPTVLTHPAIQLAIGLGLGECAIPTPLLIAGVAVSVIPDLDVLAVWKAVIRLRVQAFCLVPKATLLDSASQGQFPLVLEPYFGFKRIIKAAKGPLRNRQHMSGLNEAKGVGSLKIIFKGGLIPLSPADFLRH